MLAKANANAVLPKLLSVNLVKSRRLHGFVRNYPWLYPDENEWMRPNPRELKGRELSSIRREFKGPGMVPMNKYMWKLILMLALLLAPRAFAADFSFSYGGRLIAGGNTPVKGPVKLSFNFFRQAEEGTQILATPIVVNNV